MSLRLTAALLFWTLPWCFGVMALDWTQSSGFRSAPVSPPLPGKAGFTLLSNPDAGLLFTNVLSATRSLTNQIYLNGAGVALGDVDGDGWCDIYLCGLDTPNSLYRNLGQWRFSDITAAAGVACPDQASTGAAFADVDGDGDLDLLVCGLGRGVRLFINDGHGRFREVTEQAGLGGKMASTSLALADIDGDGFLDLYVANYRTRTLRDEPDTRFKVSTLNGEFKLLAVNGQPASSPELVGRFTVDPVNGVLENGEPDVLYRNDGHGKFKALSWTDGTFLDKDGRAMTVPYDWGLSVMFRDLNEDGAPDIYVCNDFHSEDRIWMNDGKGHFRAANSLLLRHTSLFSMGVDFADIDRDGHDDIMVADMLSRSHARRQVQVADRKMVPAQPGMILDRPQYSRNMLFWNRGDQTYSEIAQLSGLEAADWCWCPVFLDVDLDGYEDLLMVTGHERDAMNIDLSRRIDQTLKQRPLSREAQMQLRRIFPVYDSPNFAFRNRGDLTFEEVGQRWGFDSTRVSQGIALADLDNDGDLDVVINCLNAPPLLYRNDTAAPRLAIRLHGAGPNSQAIGAKIRVLGGAAVQQSQEVICGGRYIAADDPMRVFAAGSLSNRLRVEIAWPRGGQSLITNAEPNRVYVIEEPKAGLNLPAAPTSPKAPAWFQDASRLLGHQHAETPFDDFQRQPLLPRRLSQGGPGVSCYDINGDGWDDLIIGSGRGGGLAVFRNDTHGGFLPVLDPPLNQPTTRDQTTVLGWQTAPGKYGLLTGLSNYEDGLTNGAAVRLWNLADKSASDLLPGQPFSPGPLSLVDLRGDGRLALFVGGQVVPGRYPEPAASIVLVNDHGKLRTDSQASAALAGLGVVNSVVWTDLDGDGLPELIAACEWGPIRIFRQGPGGLADITQQLGMDRSLGWWQSVAVGDFDGDGRLDIVAGNWGRNSKYQSFLSQPLRLYGGDLNGDGNWELIEAYFAPDLQKLVPWKDWESLARSMPFLREQYHSFSEFSTAAVTDILGTHIHEVQEFTANTLDSMVFLNRGDHFEGHALPIDAQLAPVFGLVVADFDNDGREDVFLNQNFFAVPPDISRYDGGRGALLKGKGDGTFQAVPAASSGIFVYGEGRGAAALDYDKDGRVDLVATQNANATRLFHNEAAKPGLRVRLHGLVGNPDGIGAQLRLKDASGRLGPVREIHAGSGYWSQDAATQVLARPNDAAAVVVRWPGGKTTEVPVGMGAHEITVAW